MELEYSFLLYLHIVVTITIEREGLTDVWLAGSKKRKFMQAYMVKEGTE